jgi:hypothetical protein
VPNDKFGWNDFAPRLADGDGIGERSKQERRGSCAELVDGDAHGGEARNDVARDGNVVEAHDADVAGHIDVGLSKGEQRADGHRVIRRE